MISLVSEKRYLLVVTALQGRRFPVRFYDFVRIDVKFNGSTLSSRPVRLTKDPYLQTDAVFRLTGKQFEHHSFHKTPIKVEIFHVNAWAKKQYRIGYRFLDLRTHAIESEKTRLTWFDLLGTQNGQNGCTKPQITLGISVEDDVGSDDTGKNRRGFTRTSEIKDLSSGIIDNRRAQQVTSQQEASSATSQRNGFSQLPHELFCHIFSFVDTESRFRLRRVSKAWRDHLDDPQFYRTLKVDTEALLNPWFCGFIEERGILPHVQRLVLYSRYEVAKNPPDEPSADHTSLPVPRWSDSLAAVSEFMNYFKERGCTFQEICLTDMAISVREFREFDNGFYWYTARVKAPNRIRLLNVELEFKKNPSSLLNRSYHVRLFCDDLTVTMDPRMEPYASCELFNDHYTVPKSLHDFIFKQIQLLTPNQVESLKDVYRQLVTGRADCVIRLGALQMLADLGYYELPKEALGSYVESLPETLRLMEFDFENLVDYEQHRVVHFSKACHFFQLMPDPKDRQRYREFAHCLIHPE